MKFGLGFQICVREEQPGGRRFTGLAIRIGLWPLLVLWPVEIGYWSG